MLLLTFRHGENYYGIDTRQVTEVIPQVGLRAIPLAPAYLRGLLCFRGKVVPVVDFNAIVKDSLCRAALSTRIIMIESLAPGGRKRFLGLIAENVDRVIRGENLSTMMPGMSLAEAPYLGSVHKFEGGLVQLIKPEHLLPESIREGLYSDVPEVV